MPAGEGPENQLPALVNDELGGGKPTAVMQDCDSDESGDVRHRRSYLDIRGGDAAAGFRVDCAFLDRDMRFISLNLALAIYFFHRAGSGLRN